MAIRTVVTRGYGNGTFNGTITAVVLHGYTIGTPAVYYYPNNRAYAIFRDKRALALFDDPRVTTAFRDKRTLAKFEDPRIRVPYREKRAIVKAKND